MVVSVRMDLQRRRKWVPWALAQQACKNTIALQPQLCHSSMSPSMSSTGTWELGCELLGGAAERVTRSVAGTPSESIWASKGNACCIAMSLACRRFTLYGTFTPMAPKQSQMRARVQSRNVPAFAANTSLGCARTRHALGRTSVVPLLPLHYYFQQPRLHHPQHAPLPHHKVLDL